MVDFGSLSDSCDFGLRDPAVDWQGPLGRHNFFVVAGLIEYFSDVGIASPEKIERLLGDHLITKPSDFPKEWLAEVAGDEGSAVDINPERDPTVQSVCAISDRKLKDFHSTKPHISFAAALAILTAFYRYLHNENRTPHDSYRKVEIRYAGYYIEGINSIYRYLPIAEQRAVCRAVNLVELTLLEMQHALPVTKMTAEHVIKALSLTSLGKKDKSALRCQMHVGRTEIYSVRRIWETLHPELADEPRRRQNTTVRFERIFRDQLRVEQAFKQASV